MRFKLARHIRVKHNSEPKVSNVLKMSKKDQTKHFEQFRRIGIEEYNKEQIRNNPTNPVLQGERALRKTKEYVKCSNCTFIGSRKFFYVHKKKCSKEKDVLAMALPMINESLTANNRFLTKEFQARIIAKFRSDVIGNLCKTDEMILMIGSKLFNKLKVRKEKCASVDRSVRADMRALAKLYEIFKDLDGIEVTYNNLVDIFKSINFDHTCDAIEQSSIDENNVIQPGARSNLFYLLKKAGKYLQLHAYTRSNKTMADDVTHFLVCLNASEGDICSGARYILEQTRQNKNRRPSSLPLEEDIQKLNNYMVVRMNELLSPYHIWTKSSFIELRNIVCSRLTIINGRRGGELGRMLLSEWKEAEKDGYIDQQRLEDLR